MTDQITRSKDADLLRGWKEIAAALRASERSAQRWEESGLPVHRVPGARGEQVFAYRTEIDAWVAAGGREREFPVSADAPEIAEDRTARSATGRTRPPSRIPPRRLVALLVALVVIVLVAAAWLAQSNGRGRHPTDVAAPAAGAASESTTTVTRPTTKPIMLKVTADGVVSVIGVPAGRLARIAVPRHSLTLAVVPRPLGDRVAVRLYRVDGSTVTGEPLLTEIASQDLRGGSAAQCQVGAVTVSLEWLPAIAAGRAPDRGR
jgi:hypothetical protein